MKKRILITIITFLWLALLVGGFGALLRYANEPGQEGADLKGWPAMASVSLAFPHWTLILFAHPKCPCTQATVENLNRILARTQNNLSVHIFFYKPTGGSAEEWENTSLWEKARNMPNTTAHVDLDGHEARLFAAETSGKAVLFKPNGQVAFQGGITASRGHEGDNAGMQAVVDWVVTNQSQVTKTPAFGCHIFTTENSLTLN